LSTSDTPALPSVDLAGLTLSSATWNELKFFVESTEQCEDREGSEAISFQLERCVSEWLALQGASIRMREADAAYVAQQEAEGEAVREKTQRRVRKARRAQRELPANVARIDTSWEFRSEG
jgi:hypothetical protein